MAAARENVMACAPSTALVSTDPYSLLFAFGT
jgi:hypothetical protein